VIQHIEALRYRSLRYVSQPVKRFQVLVGPNASGKSTFLDVVAFLGDVLRVGPTRAAILGDRKIDLAQRAPDPKHLVWMRKGDRFELAGELSIPTDRRQLIPNGQYSACRYEIAIGKRADSEEVRLLAETLWLKPGGEAHATEVFGFAMRKRSRRAVLADFRRHPSLAGLDSAGVRP
jgi:hypothetical protein